MKEEDDGTDGTGRKVKNEIKLAEGVKKGQIQVAPSKSDRQKEENVLGQVAGAQGKKGKKQRDGPANDPDELQLDYEIV